MGLISENPENSFPFLLGQFSSNSVSSRYAGHVYVLKQFIWKQMDLHWVGTDLPKEEDNWKKKGYGVSFIMYSSLRVTGECLYGFIYWTLIYRIPSSLQTWQEVL